MIIRRSQVEIKIPNTMAPDQPQHDEPTVCVNAQQ